MSKAVVALPNSAEMQSVSQHADTLHLVLCGVILANGVQPRAKKDNPMASRTTPSPPDMSVADAAEYMAVTGQHVRNLIAAGVLPSYRVGRLIRLRRNEIDDAIRRLQ